MDDASWRRRGERVLLRPIPAALRDRPQSASRSPWYFVAALGAHLQTLDGGEYLDLEMGRGPNILGYEHPITQAARAAFRPATARTALFHPIEVELAEVIVSLVPCAEAVLFAKNGSDACTASVRAARTLTGRPMILSSGYHGFGDAFIADAPHVLGVPNSYRGQCESLQLNDVASLREAFERHSRNVAALIVEPAHRLIPDEAYLKECRTLCDAYGAVLIFDEVVTAFRLHLGGAQGLYGVVPDLACLGKAMANGLPISALVGRREIMLQLERSFFSMTFMHDNAAFATAKACLNYLLECNVLDRVAQTGEALRSAFDEAARADGLDARAMGFAARLDLDFPPTGRLTEAEQRVIFEGALLDHGILPSTSIFACEMMTDADVTQARAAFQHGMAAIREARDRRT
jgi:glutamate-1-semialdehyde 2,1-aminomutase/spore coat polysaccharide biosynthesis protein SpsF